MGVSLGWRSGRACGTFMASSPTGAGAGVNCGADTPHETPSRPTHVHVHYARVDPAHRGCPPPLGGGRAGARAVSPPALDFRFPRAPVLWASRALYGRPTETRPTSTTTRVPELVQVATIHPPLRGFLRSGGARWMPIYTCYLSIGRDTHTTKPSANVASPSPTSGRKANVGARLRPTRSRTLMMVLRHASIRTSCDQRLRKSGMTCVLATWTMRTTLKCAACDCPAPLAHARNSLVPLMLCRR